ncbi:MAG: DUF4118 domain-containing protein [Prolixibacteraceae bacterium]|nr:DUF4118 domain-containing protein [Prolixibacteraceae bacterium]
MGKLKSFKESVSQLHAAKNRHYILSVVVIAAVALVCTPLANTQNYHLVSFILLFIVSVLSTFMGVGPVVLASTLSALVWNFFFIPPHLTFHIDKTEDLLIFGLFFIIAIVNGVLTTRIRRQEILAREREKRTNALFILTKELSKASGIDEVINVSLAEIDKNFGFKAVQIYLQDGEGNFKYEQGRDNGTDDCELAKKVFKNGQVLEATSKHRTDIVKTFFPLQGNRLNSGVLITESDQRLAIEQQSFWETFLVQISNALEREFLGEIAQEVRFLNESDRLYKTLFNSISHELRIPVATIMAASDSIISAENTKHVQDALCSEIFTASLRLNRLIENLLNMSRLESGYISPRVDWYDANDLVNKVLLDLNNELDGFNVSVLIPDDLPLIKVDFGLMEQVLYNLVVNSTQYAPLGSKIEISIAYSNNTVVLRVADNGPGFELDALEKVFRKFFRANNHKTGGLGLGLSIVKGFVEAHNGSISVANNKGGGACFEIELPSEKPSITGII